MLYVDLPTTEELTRLANAREPGSVSIVLPTTKITQDIGASLIELKNLAKQAIHQLREAAFDKRQIAAIEEQIEDLAGDDHAAVVDSLCPRHLQSLALEFIVAVVPMCQVGQVLDEEVGTQQFVKIRLPEGVELPGREPVHVRAGGVVVVAALRQKAVPAHSLEEPVGTPKTALLCGDTGFCEVGSKLRLP